MKAQDTQSTIEALKKENHRLEALLRSFYELNTSIELEEVLKSTLTQACDLMDAEIGSIALLNDGKDHLIFVESTDPRFDKLKKFSIPISEGIAGHVARTGKTENIRDVQSDPRFYGKIDEALKHKTLAYICTPLLVHGEIIGTAQLMNRRGETPFFSDEDARLLEGFAQQAALAIHNANMHKLLLKQKAVEAEMGICSDIQQALFPKEVPVLSGFEILGMSKPAREVGGDYYTYIKNKDGSLDIVIADISGKGVSAALMVSEFHTGYHILSKQNLKLTELYDQLNAHLLASLPMGHFITSFAMRAYPEQNEVEYILAGHNPPIIQSGDGFLSLERTGPFLGLSDTPFQSARFALRPGELLTAFSDGLPEARNPNFELFEEKRIIQCLAEARGKSLSEIRSHIIDAVDQFREGEPYPDDLTLVLLRRL